MQNNFDPGAQQVQDQQPEENTAEQATEETTTESEGAGELVD